MTDIPHEIREHCAELDNIAPYPPSTPFPAQMLVRYWAADLQVAHSRFRRNVKAKDYPAVNADLDVIVPMFAACHAMTALLETDPAKADFVAAQIVDAAEMGELGESVPLWLGDDYPAVLRLAEAQAAKDTP